MLIIACEYDNDMKPVMYDSGRVFTVIGGIRHFVGTFRAPTIGEVAGLAHLNAKGVALRLRLDNMGEEKRVSL